VGGKVGGKEMKDKTVPKKIRKILDYYEKNLCGILLSLNGEEKNERNERRKKDDSNGSN